MKEYSRQHPKMPLSYAVGYALSTDYDACTMRELFRGADKNMYVDKNRAKMEEAAAEKSLQYRMLDAIKQQGFEFEDCLYCDAMLDKYRVLRAGPDLFLTQDGSYSGAVEQIAQELGGCKRPQSPVGTAAAARVGQAAEQRKYKAGMAMPPPDGSGSSIWPHYSGACGYGPQRVIAPLYYGV